RGLKSDVFILRVPGHTVLCFTLPSARSSALHTRSVQYVPLTDRSSTAPGGNNPTGPCVFPFLYGGKNYTTSYWCSTTEDYGRDGLWSYCADTAPCVFPFTYRNGTHHSCTTAGEEGGRPWCSTTDNYPRDRKWTYCQLSGTQGHPLTPQISSRELREKQYDVRDRARAWEPEGHGFSSRLRCLSAV
uniref:Fibronectin type-II domain-containing protein n=1 Tax=Ornithorhynchus anatinus TaxID=9258 RepID=A0A6I8N0B4_ORNAN